MYDIEKKFVVYSSMRKVWTALSNKKSIESWMELGNAVYFDLEVGGYYAFFSGQVVGRVTEVLPPNILEYTWRRVDWPAEWPDSLVRFETKHLGGGVEVHMKHTNLPNEKERATQDEDWDLYFIEPMTEWAETDFGGALYGVRPLRHI